MTQGTDPTPGRSAAPIPWNGYTIRQATTADIETVMHHRRSMFLDMGRKDDRNLADAMVTSRQFFSERLANGRYRAWLVESDGKVVAGAGVIIFDYHSSPLDPTDRRPMVVNVFTERGHRRRGIARKLMEVIIAWCRAEGFHSMLLHASDEGKPLYDSLGFKPTNEMRLMLR
ncbi:MAG TPA: GNAT family N-acetyltransferase [Bacteroidota bacterium]|nr:GNAT family N-acetyltransferase [Bacteroidota bacterium]